MYEYINLKYSLGFDDWEEKKYENFADSGIRDHIIELMAYVNIQ